MIVRINVQRGTYRKNVIRMGESLTSEDKWRDSNPQNPKIFVSLSLWLTSAPTLWVLRDSKTHGGNCVGAEQL